MAASRPPAVAAAAGRAPGDRRRPPKRRPLTRCSTPIAASSPGGAPSRPLRHGDLSLPECPAPLCAIGRARGDDRLIAVFNWEDAPVTVARAALPPFYPAERTRLFRRGDRDSVTSRPTARCSAGYKARAVPHS
jgi:hypothetical protein